jgi:predicted hydrolase (HD superfamily)
LALSRKNFISASFESAGYETHFITTGQLWRFWILDLDLDYNPKSNGNLLPKREEAWDLLCEFTLGDSLRKHARAVECAMPRRAVVTGRMKTSGGLAGLLHDFDYERYPDQRHPQTRL